MHIAIIDYPYSLKSAVFGINEVFALANTLQKNDKNLFVIDVITLEDVHNKTYDNTHYTAIFLPPSIQPNFYLQPSNALLSWLKDKHKQHSMLCSSCAGVFIMAASGLLKGKEVTTHWQLVDSFNEYYPDIVLNPNKLLIKNQNIITAGGIMAWLDLTLDVISQLCSPKIARQLGKLLVVDTGQREQCYYQQFVPKLNHADHAILSAQEIIHSHYQKAIRVSDLASAQHLTERTFLRRFTKATTMKPSKYLQRFRIQVACDLLENTNNSFETIANSVGYEDVSACRKAFIKIMGLTPKKFKQRFVNIQ